VTNLQKGRRFGRGPQPGDRADGEKKKGIDNQGENPQAQGALTLVYHFLPLRGGVLKGGSALTTLGTATSSIMGHCRESA